LAVLHQAITDSRTDCDIYKKRISPACPEDSLALTANLRAFLTYSIDLLIKNARVIRPAKTSVDRLDIAIAGGKIVELAPEIRAERAKDIFDAKALLAFPGCVDAHMHVGIYQPLALDARGSRDPDGNRLRYHWFHYAEAGFVPGQDLAAVSLSQGEGPQVTVTPMAACRPGWMPGAPCASGVAHIILAVTDDGVPSLTSYRRVILTVRAPRGDKKPA